MNIKRSILLIMCLFCSTVFAQEFRCGVSVNYQKLQSTTQQYETGDNKIFETMKRSIEEFVNNRHWTNLEMENQERIDCSINIILTQRTSATDFTGQISIQLRRPIYNSNYTSGLFNYLEGNNDLVFSFNESQPLEFDPNTFYDDYSTREAAAAQELSIIKDMNVVYDLKMADKEGEIHTPDRPSLERYGRDLYRRDLPPGELVPGRMNAQQQAIWDAYYDPIIARFKEDKLEGNALSEWKYQRYMRDYCSVIHSVDRNVGRVYDYLQEHGLLENTVIIYTSDQGFFMGEHGYFDKRYMYEESFRTPLLVRVPGGKQGIDARGFVQNIDYAPTILELAGLPIPEDIQGESFVPLLSGRTPRDWRRSLYYHYYEYPAEHSVRRHYGVRTDRYSLMHFYNDLDEWELFDLEKDPMQLHNLYGQSGMEEITRELKEELVRLQKLYDDPIQEKN